MPFSGSNCLWTEKLHRESCWIGGHRKNPRERRGPFGNAGTDCYAGTNSLIDENLRPSGIVRHFHHFKGRITTSTGLRREFACVVGQPNAIRLKAE